VAGVSDKAQGMPVPIDGHRIIDDKFFPIAWTAAGPAGSGPAEVSQS
jgi:hypothetical protein